MSKWALIVIVVFISGCQLRRSHPDLCDDFKTKAEYFFELELVKFDFSNDGKNQTVSCTTKYKGD